MPVPTRLCGARNPSGRTSAFPRWPPLPVSFTVTGFTAVLSNELLFAVYYLNEPLRRPAITILLALALTDFLTGAVVNSLNTYEQIMIAKGDCTNMCVVMEQKISGIYFFHDGDASYLVAEHAGPLRRRVSQLQVCRACHQRASYKSVAGVVAWFGSYCPDIYQTGLSSSSSNTFFCFERKFHHRFVLQNLQRNSASWKQSSSCGQRDRKREERQGTENCQDFWISSWISFSFLCSLHSASVLNGVKSFLSPRTDCCTYP